MAAAMQASGKVNSAFATALFVAGSICYLPAALQTWRENRRWHGAWVLILALLPVFFAVWVHGLGSGTLAALLCFVVYAWAQCGIFIESAARGSATSPLAFTSLDPGLLVEGHSSFDSVAVLSVENKGPQDRFRAKLRVVGATKCRHLGDERYQGEWDTRPEADTGPLAALFPKKGGSSEVPAFGLGLLRVALTEMRGGVVDIHLVRHERNYDMCEWDMKGKSPVISLDVEVFGEAVPIRRTTVRAEVRAYCWVDATGERRVGVNVVVVS